MIKQLKHIFIFFLIFGVFSVTLQASIIHVQKEIKIFKNKNQQNETTEEEARDGDESTDEEIIFFNQNQFYFLDKKNNSICIENQDINLPVNFKKIPFPPPKK